MSHRQLNGVCALVLALCVGRAAPAAAQCSNTCNVLTVHWGFPNLDANANRVLIGLAALNGTTYNPVACREDYLTRWLLTADGILSNAYTSPSLTADTSICAGAGNDTIYVLGPKDRVSCFYQDRWIEVRGFGGNGYTFGVSLGDGSDLLYSYFESDGSYCGGHGHDWIYGADGYQYIAGQEDNDTMSGGPAYDNVKGSSGNDTFTHLSGTFPGEDKLRGESGQDCMRVSATFHPESSCGDGTDFHVASWIWPPSCENEVQSCPPP